MGYRSYWGYRQTTVYERARKAKGELEKLQRKGSDVSPVVLEGKRIAATFWGKAWCENLEHYSDFSNRLPRGRSYVRNGSVVDLKVLPGEVVARVAGSRLYTTRISIAPMKPAAWTAVCRDCAGGIDSMVELLQGRFSEAVMARVCEYGSGLFPSPAEIKFECSCPDWASMCKHVAAVLYGVGARLDSSPELLFLLRKVDPADLVAHAGAGLPLGPEVAEEKVLASSAVSELFGIELEEVHLADWEAPAKAAPANPSARGKAGPRPAAGDAALDGALREAVRAEVRRQLAPTLELLERMRVFLTMDGKPRR